MVQQIFFIAQLSAVRHAIVGNRARGPQAKCTEKHIIPIESQRDDIMETCRPQVLIHVRHLCVARNPLWSASARNVGLQKMALCKEVSEGFLDLGYLDDFDVETRRVDAFKVPLGEDDGGHAQFACFVETLLDACHGAYLARETHLACHAHAARHGHVNVARQDGADDGQVHCRVVDAHAPGDVEENVFLDEFEAYSLLQDGQQHVHALAVKACH